MVAIFSSPSTSIYANAFSPAKKKKPEDMYSITPVGIGNNTQPQTTNNPVQSVFSKKPAYDYSTAKSVYTPPQIDNNPQPKQPSYLDTVTNIADKSKQFYEDRAKADEDLYNRLFARKIKSAQDQAPIAQEAFNQFKTNTEAGAEDSKAQAETAWGNDQRDLAKTRMETEARLRNKFAGQNTSDSFGVGSAQEANTNLESEFNRQTAQGLEGKRNKLYEIDRTAKGLIGQEALKLKKTLMDIQDTVFNSEAEKAMAIKKAYDDAKAGILEIQSNLANLKYQNASTASQPTTNNQNKALTLVNNLLNGNYQAVSGGFRTPGFIAPFVKGAGEAITDYEGLKSLLALAERGQLKGSGAVSDFEAKMLEKAALAGLNSRLPEDEFKRRLELLRNDLISGGAVSGSPQTGNTIKVGRFTVSQ